MHDECDLSAFVAPLNESFMPLDHPFGSGATTRLFVLILILEKEMSPSRACF